VHLASADDLDRWARQGGPDDVRRLADARRLAEALWPGPLTLVLPRAADVPDAVTGGRDTVGLRVPAHPVALALLVAVGDGVAAPSANRFGHVSPTTAQHVVADLGGAVDLVLDGGACTVGVESTIVDLAGAAPEVLRPGGVSVEQLAEVLGRPVTAWTGEGPARAPGMLAAHYAPRARVVLVDGPAEVAAAVAGVRAGLTSGATVGVLAPHAITPLDDDDVVELEPAGPPARFAAVLYDRLRQADRLGLVALVVVAPPAEGIGVAVRDRLSRAATGSAR
jgi:L-threonylcarbamoyladenylate synthase